MLTVIVPGMTSLAESIFALKCSSYHFADACGSEDLMCTWLIAYSMMLLLSVRDGVPQYTGDAAVSVPLILTFSPRGEGT